MPNILLPENVKKDNSNLFLFSQELAKAMKRCEYNRNRSKPKYNQGYEQMEELFYFLKQHNKHIFDPITEIEFQHDFQKFIEVYPEIDQEVFISYYFYGLTQQEIADELRVSQPTVSLRLAFMSDEFKYFFGEEWKR